MTVSQSQVRKSRRLVAGIAGLTAALLMGSAVRAADTSASQPTTADLMKQVQDLQAKVAELSTKQEAQSTVNKQDVTAAVDAVLRDADRRSQLMDMEGFTAGWDKGNFKLQSADGSFSLMPWFQMQLRSATTYNTTGDGDVQNGFELRRTILA